MGEMFQSFEVSGYRGLSSLIMGELGRINLLVGTNNSGKTSVLEALYLLASNGSPSALWNIMNGRGERLDEPGSNGQGPEAEVCHLFSGHELNYDANFSVSAAGDEGLSFIDIKVVDEPRQLVLFSESEETTPASRMSLLINGSACPPEGVFLSLTARGGLARDSIRYARIRPERRQSERNVQYISTNSLSPSELHLMWNKVVLTEGEDRILEALRIIEPRVERIAALTNGSASYPSARRGGFVVKLSGQSSPVPIGSMGDGMWRMLAMALALTRAEGGVMLVDEVDTGLHYTVMDNMWTLISRASEVFNVQVFATTHSFDCVNSLSVICRKNIEAGSQVTIQRIEQGMNHSVPYTEAEITLAAERRTEVR